MLEPNMRVACLLPCRSTGAYFSRFGPSFPDLKLLLLGTH